MSPSDPSKLDDVRSLLRKERQSIMARFAAHGVAIGKEPGSGRYVIVVYMEPGQDIPDQAVDVDGVPLRFEVTGRFRPQ